MRRALLAVAIFAFVVAAQPLPPLGTQFATLPSEKGKSAVEAACFTCHSADLLVQQRLTEKQWTAALDKMIRWGAVVEEKDRAVMLAYLVKNFGPDNKVSFRKVRPLHTK